MSGFNFEWGEKPALYSMGGPIMQSFVVIAVISVEWVLWGYSMAFGPDKWGITGGLEWFGLSGVGLEPSSVYATTIPHQLFMIYQCMFAVITPALITGESGNDAI